MLSAFTARPIIELNPRVKAKIETILAYGDRILVGLNNGALRVYRLNEPPSSPNLNGGSTNSNGNGNGNTNDDGTVAATPAKKPTDLLREVEKFSTRAIEQLAIIKEANVIVSLSNYHVSLHDRQTYEHIETLARTKNASCFAVTSNIVKDPTTGIPEITSRLAVAVRRRLLLWTWNESELGEEVVEVTLAESIRSVTWASATRIVCGMNAGYVTINVLTSEVEDIVSPGTGASGGQASRFGAVSSAGMGYMGLGGYIPKPLAAKLAEGEMVLAKDINTLFVTDEGKPVEKRQIPWQSAPESIGYSYPYIVALQAPAKGSLEVRNPDTLSLLQTISLPGAAQLHFSPPNVSLAHAGKGFHISSERVVWKMGATDYDSQIEELVESKRYDEAISILNMLEGALLKDKADTLRQVKMLKAEMLFKQKSFTESMDLFNEEEVHAPPERVLKLYPPFIAGELSGWQEKPAEGTEAEAAGPETPDEEEHHETGTNGSDHPSPDAESAAEAAPSKGGGGRFASLWRGTLRAGAAQSDTASITSSRRQDTGAEETTPSPETKPAEDGPLDDKELKDAVHALTGYLVGTRTRLQRVIDPVTARLKRTDTNGSAEETLRNLMSTTPDESDAQLEGEALRVCRLVDTALFRAYMFWRPTLARSLFRIPNFCDPDVVNEKLLEHSQFTQLVDFFYGKKLHSQALELLRRFGTADAPDEAAPELHGAQRTIAYLQSLPPSEIDLIMMHSKWALQADPAAAMEIFTADTENAETLPRDRVAKFLAGIDSDLEITYLEHIIGELDDSTPEFHNRLVELYIKHLRDKPRGEAWDREMERFVAFLKTSRQYSLGRAHGLIPRENAAFYEAQAVVFSNMGSHKQALEIYVFKMKDYAKAEEYCNRIHRAEDARAPSPGHRRQTSTATDDGEDEKPSIYHTLLSLYLTPPPPHEQALGPALDLLSKHGSRLPADSTISLIPDTLPVRELESYFRGRIRSANSVVNDSRIVAGLRATEYISSQALLLLGDGVPGGAGRAEPARGCDGGEAVRCMPQETWRKCRVCAAGQLGRALWLSWAGRPERRGRAGGSWARVRS